LRTVVRAASPCQGLRALIRDFTVVERALPPRLAHTRTARNRVTTDRS
jgi:hypothetical protein